METRPLSVKAIDIDNLPRHYDAPRAEQKWGRVWEDTGVYRYDPQKRREDTFVIDTPPPTVSGALHIGHVFSYTHTDVMVRYRRMAGKNIYYPMGWDDNGLPTERRVQNYFHVRCDPSLPYREDLKIEAAGAKTRKEPPQVISRKNFIELCHRVTQADEQVFLQLWTRAGLSVDWKEQYATIDDHCRRLAQISFIDLYEKGHVYNTEAPTMWDVDFQTAVAQAEVEERTISGAYHRIHFGVEGEEEGFDIATTRPELIPACVGVTAHPEDSRYRHLFGRKAVTPLFRIPVPIFPSPMADPEKGTGILMVCTFGDAVDVVWWRTHDLSLRQIIGLDGRLLPVDFRSSAYPSLDPEGAAAAYAEIQGKSVGQARKIMVELLDEPLRGEPEEIQHPVKFYQKGDRPLEFVPTRQWFVRLLDKKEMLLEKGNQIQWYPDYMRLRFLDWTENLQFDWNISRQRYFGVSFPLWYPLDGKGNPIYADPLLAEQEQLPVDPAVDLPPGYEESRRDKPGGFTAEMDVFDTWFTSSLSPQIGSFWVLDPERHKKLFPMDLRPQGHDIIRTWAFYTIVKAALHEGTIPWKQAAISGFIMDPDRKKMSKSKGNVVTPMESLEKFSADGVRYWASGARLGTDALFDEKMLKIGKRLVTKIFNASKFVLGQEGEFSGFTEDLDRAFLGRLREAVRRITAHHEGYEFSHGLAETETFFWGSFTDTYIELVKTRAREEDPRRAAARGSAVMALRFGLNVILRLFAPIVPYITEEAWSWYFAEDTGFRSVHLAPWPGEVEFADIPTPDRPGCFDAAVACLSAIHKHKTLSNVSVGKEIADIEIALSAEAKAELEPAVEDVMSAARAARWTLSENPKAEGCEVVRAQFL